MVFCECLGDYVGKVLSVKIKRNILYDTIFDEEGVIEGTRRFMDNFEFKSDYDEFTIFSVIHDYFKKYDYDVWLDKDGCGFGKDFLEYKVSIENKKDNVWKVSSFGVF